MWVGRALGSILLPSQQVLGRQLVGLALSGPSTGTGQERRKQKAVVNRGGHQVSWRPGQVPSRGLFPWSEDAWSPG